MEQVEWGKDLSVASQIVDERHWYLAVVETREAKLASGGSIWRRLMRRCMDQLRQSKRWFRGVPAGQGEMAGAGRSGERGTEERDPQVEWGRRRSFECKGVGLDWPGHSPPH